MSAPLNPAERRAIGQRARSKTLDALEALGGEACRHDVQDWVLAHGGFTARELAAPAPEAAGEKYASLVDHQLGWALTDLKRDGLVEKPQWGTWRLTSAGRQPIATAVDAEVGAKRLVALRAMCYQDYLRTPEWRRTRAAALRRAGNCCSLNVNHTDRLEVHHRTYENRGAELITDLLVLCHSCHQLHHEAWGLPGRDSSTDPTELRAQTGRTSRAPLTAPLEKRKPSLLKRLLADVWAERPALKGS